MSELEQQLQTRVKESAVLAAKLRAEISAEKRDRQAAQQVSALLRVCTLSARYIACIDTMNMKSGGHVYTC